MATSNRVRAANRDILARLRTLRIVPVIVIDDPKDAVPLAAALIDGGLSCAEITFRTAGAREALRQIAAAHPRMLAGAGTVLTPRQAAEAVDYCLEHEIPVYPGVCTPTEIEMALGKGLETVKFFPAEPIGGLPYLKAISAPYGSIAFMPTGGINPANLPNYLGFRKVVACGGSWMAPADWIATKQFGRIRAETEKAVALVREVPIAGESRGATS